MRAYNCGKYSNPSVTYLLSEYNGGKTAALSQWAANCATKYINKNCGLDDVTNESCYVLQEDLDAARFAYKSESKQALIYGSITHRIIQRYLTTGKLYKSRHKEVQKSIKAFFKFADDYALTPLECEKIVHGNGWSGTLDLIGTLTIKRGKKVKRVKYVLDWKTSKALYGDERMQIAAYRSTQKDIEGCGIVRLDKETGEYQFFDTSGHKSRSRNTWEYDLLRFEKRVELWHLDHPKLAKKTNYKEG